MKLNYITPPENEGGAAVPGCGTIRKSEIQATLIKLSNDLEFTFDLNDYILASTGKREYSGDIDVVLDDNKYSHGHKIFYAGLIKKFGQLNVARNGDMVHLKYPIVGYDDQYQESKPRTGFVQVDFNFGNADWERFYHFSPGDVSGYKGAHRNLAIAAICGTIANKSTELDSFDRPVTTIRWKWAQKGFLKVDRQSVMNEESQWWNRKQVDIILEGPIFDGNIVASILLPKDGVLDDLQSLETIIAAVKRNYNTETQEQIWKRMAKNFSEWKDGKNFIYPSEISEYFLLNDK